MATELFSPILREDKRQFLTCPLCLDIFRSPRLLPCHHCFCLHCLENLAASHAAGAFPCPQCRREVKVPSEGVAAFQTNFYIREEDLERARERRPCLTHPKQELDLYCMDCQHPACDVCVTTKHGQHDVQEIHKATRQIKQQLKEDEDRLQTAVSYMIDLVTAGRRERQSAQDKKQALEKAIRRKQAWMKSVVDKCCNDSLTFLTSVSQDLDSRLKQDLDTKQNNLDQLLHLQQRLQQAVSSGAKFQLLAVAKEMREGRGSTQAVNQLTSAKKSSVRRQVLSCKMTEDSIMPLVRDFFGDVEEMTMEVTIPNMKVMKQFLCTEEEDAEVFSLCPLGNGSRVLVSFARRGMEEDVSSEQFDENGKHISTPEKVSGKRSWKSIDNWRGMNTISTHCYSTFDKSQKKATFKLFSNASKEKTEVQVVTVTSEVPFRSKHTTLFTIDAAEYRAFDVDSGEQNFVVLEEKDRKVRLYRRGQRHAGATYQLPEAAATCRPSDVCFWREPGGREVLVIADEGTDSLHVVDVQGGGRGVQGGFEWLLGRGKEFFFEGYLAPGSPLIVQPVALNTDTRGRLWVALRGGQIITLSAIE